ncbi:MAG: ABC transporter ATP-binding protein [Clostridia bacterium]|nr:ABC transporter ATP-binding protein [Clostridia bacterium]
MGLEKSTDTKSRKSLLTSLMSEIKWMYGYAKKYWKFVLVHIVLGIVSTVMGLLSTLASKYLIDAVTGAGDMPIVQAACIMIGMTAGSIISKAVCSRIGARISIKVQNEIQYEVYEKIMSAQWEEISEYRSGDLLNRLNGDVSTVANGIIGLLPSLITHIVQFAGALVIILNYDPIMALIALIGAPVTVTVSNILLKKMRAYNHEMRRMSSEIMAFWDESFQNMESIKAFDVNDKYESNMVSLQDKYKNTYLKFNIFSIKTSSLMSVLGAVVSFSCMGWGVYRLWSGVITFGTMTLFLQLASMLSSAFSQLVSLVPSGISAATSAGRIMPVCSLEKEKYESEQMANEVEKEARQNGISIELDNATFAYKGSRDVLKNACIKAEPGEIVAIVGPSGEGKTTLVRLLLGLVKIESGSASVASNGKKCAISAATRKLFAYVPQGNTAFPGSVADNMRLVKSDADDEQIADALKIACAYDFVMKMQNGTASIIGEQGKGLSEGQAQRISIARAMLREAPVLLLDEATSALDIATERRVLKNIMQANPKKTCIVTTHRPSVLSMCSRVYKVEKTVISEVSREECERMLMEF